MTRDQRKDLVEIAGVIAIVLSLIFLALEVRQNTTAMTAAAFQARSEDLQSLAIVASTSEVLARIEANYLLRRDDCHEYDNWCYEIDRNYIQSLSLAEYRQYRNFLTAHAHRLTNLVMQYQYGLLTEEYHLGGVVGAIKGFMPRWEAFDVPQRGRLAAYVEAFENDSK
jgi:hypothetical protein